MASESVIYSVAKLGQRHFWVAGSPDAIYGVAEPAIAEGVAATKEEALEAIHKVLAERGIEDATGVFSYYAKCYRKYRREAEKPREPQTATFQDQDYLWDDRSYFSDHTGEHVTNWQKRQVVRVTSQYVFVQDGNERNRRLDRVALESNGHVGSYFTEAGLQAHLAEMAESERLCRERWAAEAEKLRVSLIGKSCVFCGGEPDGYTLDNHPTCDPCFQKADGYYRVPSHVIMRSRGVA